jgi:hypothetical protein
MNEISQILDSPSATVMFFYSSLFGFLLFGAAVSWLQAAENQRQHPQPHRATATRRR